MILPRNEYTRLCAKQAGHLRARAANCGGVRLSRDGKAGEWLIDDDRGYVDRIYAFESEAYRWRSAWWCSENAGVRIERGELTLKALAMQVVWFVTVLAIPLAVIGALFAIMWFGAMVLR